MTARGEVEEQLLPVEREVGHVDLFAEIGVDAADHHHAAIIEDRYCERLGARVGDLVVDGDVRRPDAAKLGLGVGADVIDMFLAAGDAVEGEGGVGPAQGVFDAGTDLAQGLLKAGDVEQAKGQAHRDRRDHAGRQAGLRGGAGLCGKGQTEEQKQPEPDAADHDLAPGAVSPGLSAGGAGLCAAARRVRVARIGLSRALMPVSPPSVGSLVSGSSILPA